MENKFLIIKSNRKLDPDLQSSYRPIKKLDIAGKLFEILLKPQLTASPRIWVIILVRNMRDRSRVGAVEEVAKTFQATQQENHNSRKVGLLSTMDERNTLYSARWIGMLKVMKNIFKILPQNVYQIARTYVRDRDHSRT